MSQTNLPIRPEEATKILLKKLPSRRMRDVLEKRFGLRGGKRRTLEAIGKEYKITRERVRQIEAEAIRQLSKPEKQDEVQPILRALEAHIRSWGDVMSERHFFETVSDSKKNPHISLLLHVGVPFHALPETDDFHSRWTVNKETARFAEKAMEGVAAELVKIGSPVAKQDLHEAVSRNCVATAGNNPIEEHVVSYVRCSKAIRQNPYGEYGLSSWLTISPRGVRDKAYLVLARSGKPMHFRDVAVSISQAGWGKRKAHPQTVHNELIKDSRFVLVGRGLYALKQWGYETGTVKDVLISVLKTANSALHRDDIVKAVLERRFVKPPTILLNLQNRSLFKKSEGDRYTLA